MLSYLQAILLGLLQGVSELFPISSLGHSIILPQLLGWHIRQSDNGFIIFLVATHLATALVLLAFYWQTWVRIVQGIIRSLKERQIRESDSDAKLGWLLIVGTIPAGILGVLFEQQIKNTFVTATSAALFLTINGFLLLGAEYLRKNARAGQASSHNERISKLTWPKAFGIGMSQALALIPGLSRSGSSMAGSLLAGLSHEDAVHFAFLLATPIILGAAVLKLPELIRPEYAGLIGPSIVGAIGAGATAYFSVKFLTKYFKLGSLLPFAIYCIGAGGLTSLIFLVRH